VNKQAQPWSRWLIPLAGLITLVGYWGPWVDHAVAGLVITGLDLGEYVKFLPGVRGGELRVWREGFYWPLVVVSLSQSLYSFRAHLRYGWAVRAGMLIIAVVAALNLLPPAWTPARLLTPEFRLQSSALGICLAAVAFSPLLALLPSSLSAGLILLFCLPALWFPIQGFLQVLPEIALLYNRPLQPGWGVVVMGVGLLLLALGCSRSWQVEKKIWDTDEHG
jgi:hypothetical protein